MNKLTNDISEIILPYENMWIALTLDNKKVVDSDKSINHLVDRLEDKDIRNFRFMKVPRFAPVCMNII